MPLSFVRQGNPKVYIPGYKSGISTSAFDQAIKSAYSGLSDRRLQYGDFEADQIAKIEGGRADLNANQLVNLAIKGPVYAAEAPLRLPNELLGGIPAAIAGGIASVVSQIPVLNTIVGGAGEGLKYLDYAGAGFANQGFAGMLAAVKGKPDNYVYEMPTMRPGQSMTAGEIRAKALAMWGYDFEGNQYTLSELEERAINNPWDFGQFSTSEDALTDFAVRSMVNPMNLLFVPGVAGGVIRAAGSAGRTLTTPTRAASAAFSDSRLAEAGARYAAGASRAQSWARSLLKPVTPIAGIGRYGYGYAKSLGRGIGAAMDEAHNPNPFRRDFPDLNNASKGILRGEFVENAYLQSALQAFAWAGRGAKMVTVPGVPAAKTALRKIYLPGYNPAGMSTAQKFGAGSRAWMRGGLQQEAAQLGGDFLFGELDSYMEDNGMENTFIGGIVNDVHNVFNKVHNSHPLSDHDAYVVASLFLPFSRSGREIVAEPFIRYRKGRSKYYVNNTARQVRDRANKLGAGFANDEAMFAYLGDGDIARGTRIFEWAVEHAEVRKVENQLSHLTQQIADAEIDGMAERMSFMTEIVRNGVRRRRQSGALNPRSTADYMYELHQQAGVEPGRVKASQARKERGLSSEFTATGTSLFDEIKNLYRANEVMGTQAAELGLSITKGGIISKESVQMLARHLETVDDFDQVAARQIIEEGPYLVYEDDFWREFSVTLGEKQKSGLPGRKVSEAEDVTKEDLLAALNSLADELPSQMELMHETIRMAKSVGTIRKGVLNVRETPYPMGQKLKANRVKTAGRAQALATNDRQFVSMRNNEFFKSGKPKFGTADEVTSQRGTVYKRQPSGAYQRDDGVSVTIEDGAIRLDIPISKEIELMDRLNKTTFRSGPRKGQIKPGMEAEGQQLNLDIEALRLGIDEDALLLATENGGRVIVADPIAGPWLAKRGYVESARIEHRYPKWIDPGDKPRDYGDAPQPGDKIDVWEDGNYETYTVENVTEEGDFLVAEHGRVVDKHSVSGVSLKPAENWRQAMTEGVMRGAIEMDDAIARGWWTSSIASPDNLLPVPQRLYHATTDMRGVKNRGVLTRRESGRLGLGGPDSWIATTDDPAVAERIKDVLIEVGKVLREEITFKDLWARAKKGGFAETFKNNYFGSGPKSEAAFQAALKGDWTIEKHRQVKDGEVLPPDAVTYEAPGEIFPDPVTGEMFMPERIKMVVEREPMPQWQRQETLYSMYKRFLKIQDYSGGPMNPVLVGSDVKGLAAIRPDNVGVIKMRPANQRAMAMRDPSEPYLKEWKILPDSVEIEGISNMAAYSFRGGDPLAIKENSAAGAFRPYRPTRRFERTERAAIGVARGDARRASLLLPSDWAVGPPLTPATSMFPEERLRQLKEHMRSTKNAYKIELQKAAEMDELAFSLLPFDKKITDMNLTEWLDPISPKEYVKVREFFEAMEEFPNLSVNREPRVLVDPASDRFATFQTTLNRRQQMLIDYGPLSPVQRFYDAILAPKHARWLGKQAQNEVHNLLTVAGWSPGATRQFMASVRKEVLESRSVVGFGKLTGAHRYPSVQALPEEKLRAIARDISPAETQAVIDRYGTFQHMITQASNRLLRTTEKAARAGGKVNKIEAAADAAFRVWQYAPGFRSLSGATQRFTKFTYPYIRFFSDPLFAVMNWLEPYSYNILNNGYRGLRGPTAHGERLGDLASAGLIPPGGLYSKEVASELLLADPGFYTIPRNIRPNMLSEFEIKTAKTAEQMFDAMGPNHPIAMMMRERFGDNIKDWAKEFNGLMANMVQRGPDEVVRGAWKKTLEKELGFTHEELKQLAPVAERLGERYRGIYSDLADLYIGRMNRSNLERFANSYFVMWPVSYMVKVTAWAYRLMMEKIGPVQGSAGTLLWDSWRQRYERMYNEDADFRAWTEDNPDFLFAMEMMVPITPASIGVSLNRTTRYAGNWIGEEYFNAPNVFGQYTPDSVPDMFSNSLRFGPIRTMSMGADIMKGFGVPGFYSEPTQNQTIDLLP